MKMSDAMACGSSLIEWTVGASARLPGPQTIRLAVRPLGIRPGVLSMGVGHVPYAGLHLHRVVAGMIVLLPRLRRSCTRYMPCVSNVWLVVQRRLTVLLPSSYGSQFSVASDLVPSPQSHSISGQ